MLIDSHAHLPYNKKLTLEILDRAQKEGVEKVITIATNLKESAYMLKMAADLQNVYAVIGVYPHEEKDKSIEEMREQLERLIKANLGPKLVGIGECGIDITNWENLRPLPDQIALFEMQIELALKYDLPIVIHNRNGDEHILKSLQKYPNITGVAHCFTQDWEFAQKLLNLGFYISFSGFITHNSKSYLLETVRNVPNNKFVIETDSPYILPKGVENTKNARNEPKNGVSVGNTFFGRNEPKNVKIVAQKVAQTKGLTFEETCNLAYHNTCALFKLDDRKK